MSTPEYERQVAELRREAQTASEQDENLAAKYFASWLVFYIDQHAKFADAWQTSIDRLGAL